jgi:hypothetical protein
MAYDIGLADRVRSILGGRPGVAEQKMFGGLAFLIYGRMCCGVIKTDLMVRLTPEAVTRALERPHTRQMDFTGKPIKSMLYVDAQGTDSDEALHEWVESAVAIALALPSKKPAVKKSNARKPVNRRTLVS